MQFTFNRLWRWQFQVNTAMLHLELSCKVSKWWLCWLIVECSFLINRPFEAQTPEWVQLSGYHLLYSSDTYVLQYWHWNSHRRLLFTVTGTGCLKCAQLVFISPFLFDMWVVSSSSVLTSATFISAVFAFFFCFVLQLLPFLVFFEFYCFDLLRKWFGKKKTKISPL